MSTSEYLTDQGFTHWHGDFWRDPWRGKVWNEADALLACQDYDRDMANREFTAKQLAQIERIKADRLGHEDCK